MAENISALRRHFTASALHALLSSDERTKFLEEVMSLGQGCDYLDSIIHLEDEEQLPPEGLIEHAFAWNESLYGEAYWKAIHARVASSGTKSKDEVIKGIVEGYTFERVQEKLEAYLKVLGYRHASMHDEDKHVFLSSTKAVRVATSNGYLHIASKHVSAHTIVYSDIREMKLIDDTIVITLQSGSIVLVS